MLASPRTIAAGAVVAALRPREFEQCLLNRVAALYEISDGQRWAGLKAIGMTTNVTWRDGEERIETRYYILSRYVSAKRFAEAVRSHGSIENNLHLRLDVTFGEDQCRVRKDHTDENLSLLRRTALSLLKNEQTTKIGVKNKRLNAGWDEDYLAKGVFGT